MEELETRRVDELVSSATRSAIRNSVGLLAAPFPDAFKLTTLTFGVDGVVRQPRVTCLDGRR